MSLSTDRPLSQAMRYAHHRLAVQTRPEMLASALAFDHYSQQFDRPTRDRMTAVYLRTLAGAWVEDRRSRGRQL
jgi:hypothetical protein